MQVRLPFVGELIAGPALACTGRITTLNQKPLITRWKIVPSYSGTPCFFACEMGLVQSLVPFDSPMKLATPMGASLGKSSQDMSPAVVWMMAVPPLFHNLHHLVHVLPRSGIGG